MAGSFAPLPSISFTIHLLIAMLLITVALVAPRAQAAPWRDASNRASLQNDALRAEFQAGHLVRLTDRTTDRALLAVDPTTLPASLPLFGTSGINLDRACPWCGLHPYFRAKSGIHRGVQ